MILLDSRGKQFFAYKPGETLEQAEAEIILMALDANNHIRIQTALSLGICVRTLQTKVEKLFKLGLLSESDLQPQMRERLAGKK